MGVIRAMMRCAWGRMVTIFETRRSSRSCARRRCCRVIGANEQENDIGIERGAGIRAARNAIEPVAAVGLAGIAMVFLKNRIIEAVEVGIDVINGIGPMAFIMPLIGWQPIVNGTANENKVG
jgi:hypothetical protein